MKTKIEKIKRFCKSAEMMGFIYSTGKDDYQTISEAIEGSATVEKMAEAVNATMQVRYTIDVIDDEITREGFEEYLQMSESEFKKVFRQVQCYDYDE